MDRIPPITIGTEADSERVGERKGSAGARLYVRLINEPYAKAPDRTGLSTGGRTRPALDPPGRPRTSRLRRPAR